MRVTGMIGDNTDPQPFPLSVEIAVVGFNPRDIFACFALAGIISSNPEASVEDRAVHAYVYADEMLRARRSEED